ncbi:hypothetical protein ACHAWF_014643 [Thalassiosira exigua]
MSDSAAAVQANFIVHLDSDTESPASANKSLTNHRFAKAIAAVSSALLLAAALSARLAAANGGNAGIRARSLKPTTRTLAFFGNELKTNEELGIELSEGLNVRVIANTGEKVQYADGGESALKYHEASDAAGIVPLDPNNPLQDGYVYVTNSEMSDEEGGVYGIYFDRHGNVEEYKVLLPGTTDNCGGGLTPWHTWVSCEEYEDGQCWQVDPNPNGPNHDNPQVTVLGGEGGRYESVAVDDRNSQRPIFFTTEDHERGAMRRFVANGRGWDALHSDGETTFLRILDDGTYEWTADEEAARDSAEKYYRNSEGVNYHDGKLYFMAKKDQKLLVLDLENSTYEAETTGMKFYGEGSFGDQPDQGLFGPTEKWLYFTEDGGSTPGVYARRGHDGTYFTMFQSIEDVYDDDETIGIALSPDNTKFYAGFQEKGVIFEFTRQDGQPFE